MGRSDLRAKIRLEGDAKGANKAIKSTETRFQRLTQTIRRSALAQVAAIGSVALALRGIARGIKESIELAAVQELAFNALEGALAPLGEEATKVARALAKDAAELQKVSRFGDEVIINAQALIASFVREEDAIKAATRATIDLAEAKGFDLVAAADLVSKTLGSSTNALTRYGIEVTGAVGSTERLNSLTENIAKVFGGRALKATETFAGAMDQLKNSIGDAKEGLGQAVTGNQSFITSIRDGTKFIQENEATFIRFGEAVIKFTVAIGKAATFVIGVFDEMGQVIGDKINAVLIPLREAVDGVEISEAKLSATAARLGISMDELRSRLEAGVKSNDALRGSTDAVADSHDDAAAAALKNAEAQAVLDKASGEAATAMEKLGAALGIVTSIELAGEIAEIEAALEAARVATGGFSQEFIQMKDVAEVTIAGIERRMESLKNGTGDLAEAVDDTAISFDGWTTSLDNTNTSLDSQIAKLNEERAALGLVEIAVLNLTQAEERRLRLTGQTAPGGTQLGISSGFGPLFDNAPSGGTFTVLG